MKVTLRISSLVCGLVLWGTLAWAQPANDRCSNAIPLTISSSEANVVLVSADTRGATTSGNADSSPIDFCFVGDNDDDVWFKITTPASLPDQGFVIRAYFNNSVVSSDLVAVGMALYESCGESETSTHCFTSADGKIDRFTFSGICALPQHDYYLRVWSEGDVATDRGTFRMGAYIAPVSSDVVLWSETFGGGLEANGWTTLGTCSNPDSNLNGGFVYLPEGLVDNGAYAFPGYRVSGASWCDGAAGFDSDWNDNGGVEGAFMSGQCPQNEAVSEQILTSPIIAIDNWNVPGISLTWTQAIREFRSTYKI
ncbi:MAG TPA: hypothetical protein VMZ69_11855, partial [Saprospiraceae bacterium]|nr:hypothetical protein [Saprospiraceae bacterium]